MRGKNSQSGATTIYINVDRDIKSEVEDLFKNMGISLSSAVNMFFRQVLVEQAIPFQPKTEPKILSKPKITLEERLNGFDAEYEYYESDTGLAVGSEIINDIYS